MKLYQRLNRVQNAELHSRMSVIDQMSKTLKSYHLLIKGLGHMTDDMLKDYDDIVKQIKTPCSVSWDEDLIDSGVSSGDSVTTIIEKKESVGTKRKLVESVESSNLDKTFTLPTVKPKESTVRAEQLMAKGGLIHTYVSVIAVEVLQCMFASYVTVIRNE